MSKRRVKIIFISLGTAIACCYGAILAAPTHDAEPSKIFDVLIFTVVLAVLVALFAWIDAQDS